MGVVNFLEAMMGMHVDTREFEEGLRKAENLAESTTKSIQGGFNVMAAGIATALVGTVVVALEKAIKTTADWGLEMEHLGNRMGMTSQEAATLVGVLERFGVNSGIAARAMQVMAMEAKQTTDSLDPFATKMGRVLGSLRDTSGQALNLGQVLDLARQKVSAAATETEKLQVAQSLVGSRLAGQLLPVLKLSNDEWERQKKSVSDAIGPVDDAAKAALEYKAASAQLEQTFRGLEITIGSKLLPVFTEFIENVSNAVKATMEFGKAHPLLLQLLNPLNEIIDGWHSMNDAVTYVGTGILKLAEALHLVDKGTADMFSHMQGYQEEARKAAAAKEQEGEAAEAAAKAEEKSERIERQLVQLAQQKLRNAEEAAKLGLGGQAQIEVAAQERLTQLTEQRLLLEKELQTVGLTGDSKKKLQDDLLKNQVEAAQTVSKVAEDQYKSEELQIKANGAFNLSSELQLLEKKLADERIVGDERLKVESEVYQKRTQYMQEAIKVGRDLGIVSVDQEIEYRKSRAAELLGKGDVLGAGKELQQSKQLAIKQGDEQMDFIKKLRTVSIQDEIQYQTQKLNLVKGNAEEEMKVLSTIADLDKKLYEERLQFGLKYTSGIMDSLKALQDAQNNEKKGGESESFDRARADANRQLPQVTRMLNQTAEHGGTEGERSAAVAQAQKIEETFKTMQETGKDISSDWMEAEHAARDLLKAASGGEEVRAPGGPSPTVGSIMSSTEGLATQGLARGSDIPRLDTSFTDLAVRIRDVLLGSIPSIQNFSNAAASAAQKIATITGVGLNPGIVGPGGGISNGGQSQGSQVAVGNASPGGTSGPGNVPLTPTPQVGVSSTSGGSGSVVDAISDLKDSLVTAIQQQTTDTQTQAQANADSLSAALAQAQAERRDRPPQEVRVTVDPNSGDLLVGAITTAITSGN